MKTDKQIKAESMSLRDYFAGQALIGLIGGRQEGENYDIASEPGQQNAAEISFGLADAMLTESARGSAASALQASTPTQEKENQP